MQYFNLETHIGADGILHLELPVGMKNTDLEVTVSLAEVSPVADNDAQSLLALAGMFESGTTDTSTHVRPIVTEFLLQKHAAHSTP